MNLKRIELEKVIEKNKQSKIFEICEILLKSLNDWSNDINELEVFDYEIKQFILADSTKKNIEKKLKNIDYSKYSWQSESLYGLMELFNYYENNISLTDIISLLRKDIIKIEDL